MGKDISRDHPEVKKLFGPDHFTKYTVAFALCFQLFSLHLLMGAPWYQWLFCCYTLSGTINHGLTLAMHEASHGLMGKGVTRNKVLGIFANLSMVIPAAISFKRYHMEHHRYQGEDIMDVDIPCALEGWFFRTRPRKVLWCFFNHCFIHLDQCLSIRKNQPPGSLSTMLLPQCLGLLFIDSLELQV